MNMLKYMLFLSICFTACNNDEALPFVEFDELSYGAYPRLIDGFNGEYGTAFKYDDVEGSTIDFTVEFFDENQGANISAYNWKVNYSDGSSADIGTIVASSFTPAPSGLPSATVRFTFEEVLKALGKDISEVAVDERFIFEATLIKTDGTEFTSQSSSGSIQNTAGTIRGIFQVVVDII